MKNTKDISNKVLVVFTSLVLSLISELTFASCYQVKFKEKFDPKSCSQVEVSASEVDCGQVPQIVKDLGSYKASVDCSAKPYKLQVPAGNVQISAELKETNLWGEPSFHPVNVVGVVTKPTEPIAENKEPVKSETEKKPKKKPKPVARAPVPVPLLVREVASVPVNTPPITEVKPPVVESPVSDVQFKLSGAFWFETEESRNFGYNGTSAVPNFTDSRALVSTLFSNVQLDVVKGATQFTSIFEVGEMLEGDSASGGAQGGRQKVLEVRNIYLGHNLSDEFNIKVGLQPILADPNGFILSDHYLSEVLTYTQSWGAISAWHAKAAAAKPALTSTSTGYVNPDQYLGFQVQSQWTDSLKNSLYGVSRRTVESLYDVNTSSVVTGKSDYTWAGTTMDWEAMENLSFQGTYILNSGKFAADSNGPTDSVTANLVDVKIISPWKEHGMTFLLEALSTTGAGDSVTTGQSVQNVGGRKNFASPNPGAAYLLTLATSDGADDAPGTAKESIIGSLAQNEGVQIYVFKVSKDFSDKLSGFARAGVLKSTEANAVTNSKDLGSEWDIGGNYLLSKDLNLQVDFATFKPGAFYTTSETATLITTRLKFSF